MATIGQSLRAPESGWKRIDDTSSIFTYEGSWSSYSASDYYGGSRAIQSRTVTGNKIKFTFYGTKLRLIASTYLSYTPKVNITIDGVTESYSLLYEKGLNQALVYEKLNLPLDYHSVEIERVTAGAYSVDFNLDAIDIDADGELIRYDYFENTHLDENIRKYGVAWFGFDEASGNVTDKLGGSYVGTVTGATRVDGWNGEGKAMSFSGSGQYVAVNNPVIPAGEKSIRFKIKTSVTINTTTYRIFDTSDSNNSKGFTIYIYQGKIRVNNRVNSSVNNVLFSSEKLINDGKWHDVLFTWNGLKGGLAKLYIDDILEPSSVIIADYDDVGGYSNMNIGRSGKATELLNGQIDDLQVFSKELSLSDLTKKRVAIKTTDNKVITLTNEVNRIKEIPSTDESDLINQGYSWREIDEAVDTQAINLNITTTEYEKVSKSNVALGNGKMFTIPISKEFKTIKVEKNY